MQLSTSGGGEQQQQEGEVRKQEKGEEYNSDQFDDEFLTAYCKTAEIPQPMSISKELFFTNEMVAQNYDRLSKEDKDRFN